MSIIIFDSPNDTREIWACVVFSPVTKVDCTKVGSVSDSHAVTINLVSCGLDYYITSLYCQFSLEKRPFIDKLIKIKQSIPAGRHLVAIDSNSKSTLWHCDDTNDSGGRLE